MIKGTAKITVNKSDQAQWEKDGFKVIGSEPAPEPASEPSKETSESTPKAKSGKK
jgi:hypothetical protein